MPVIALTINARNDVPAPLLEVVENTNHKQINYKQNKQIKNMTYLNKTKSLFLLLGLACLTTFFITCKNPVSDLQVTASADFVSAPSEFRIFDASSNQPEAAMENVAVKITGPAAPFIYNPGGKKLFVINNGIIQVSFRRGTVVAEAMPLKFNIEVAIAGYLTKIYPVTLTNLDPVTQTIFLVNLNNLPKGSAKISANIATNTSGTTTSETIVTLPTNANKTEVAELTIPTGVTMKDKDGNPVTGNVDVNVLQFAGSGQQALDAFGNIGDNTIKDINGNTLTETVIAPLGWLNINMTAGNKEVKTFSSPLKGKIGIPAGLVNPISGAEYKEGDAISVLSKEDDGTEYKKEGTATLQKANDGSLFAELNITHLSGWYVADILEACGFNYEIAKIAYYETNSIVFLYLNNVVLTYYKANGDTLYKQRRPKINLGSRYDPTKGVFHNFKVYNLAPLSIDIDGIKVVNQRISGEALNFPNVKIPKTNNPCSIGNIVSGPSTAISTTKGKFRAKCTSGSTNYATLPDGFTLYYVKKAVFLAAGSPGVTNPVWKSTSLNVEDGYNTCTIDKTDLAGGGELLTAILYDGRRYEYIQNIPATVPDEISVELSIPCSN